jgi:predicted Zn finger-like uncharacterized protein
MYTRCPGCQAGYELTAALLAEASGVVRCGNCGKTFNTLSHLFNESPDEHAEPIRGGGMPPMLEHAELVQTELPVAIEEETGLEPDPDPPEAETDSDQVAFEWPEDRGWRAPERLWPAVSAVLLVLLLAQSWLLWQTPGSPLARLAGGEGGSEAVNPNEAIQIISRDMHPHPSLDDAMVVSANLRNTGQFTIAWPVMEVRFYDASQQLLGVRRLEPVEYLHDERRVDGGMAPGTIVPLIMEFVVGASEPAGFQIRFY